VRTGPVQFKVEPRFRLQLGKSFAFGPGKADLLEHIARTGSIREAASAMGMSYMRAWSLVKSLDQGLKEPLVRKRRGGQARGGAELTEAGKQLLQVYRELERQAAVSASHAKERLIALLPKSDE